MSACKSSVITTSSEDEDEFLFAMEMNALIGIPMVLKATVELGILEMLAEGGPSGSPPPLSPAEIASRLPTKNPEAPVTLDRMMRLLASNSILSCTLAQGPDGDTRRLYGLGPRSKYFMRTRGASTFPASMLLYLTDKIMTGGWYCLKDAIMEGGRPFELANGMNIFEYASKDDKFNVLFNNAMQGSTNVYMNKIVEIYRGFDNAKTVVDVGGGVGATLRIIVSKNPHIHGINFDLPHVVREASSIPGVEHVEGDVTKYIPKADVILLKWLIHCGDEEFGVKVLKNCWEALPEKGKVVIMDVVLPEYPDTDAVNRNSFLADIWMLSSTPGGKMWTEKELQVMALAAGFDAPKVVCRAYNMWVVELHKKI
ncbi:caffeic acid 3-O-methyltransferase-like isoform X2 [Syzygium oleosum]|uniref:caffeic acid 3-O-methyltransferase-like isoform X2 n=1 Tax=Syzygium oleosum TaxID=219896 RepID=UPI0011D203D9|nr:caffeic acid 3-O-methyltransferase-like isoform X2 [Syzygium oleosum]